MTWRSDLQYLDTLSQTHFASNNNLIIYDKKLLNKKYFARWLSKYPKIYGVRAGEKLKDLEGFPKHLRRLLKILGPDQSRSQICLVGIGGGSVGDFVGFTASILKRGVALSHLPSTFLAAIDSAHGGKTALNVDGVKNQIGTFYPAHHIFIIKELLAADQKQMRSAFGELIKMALLTGGTLYDELTSDQEDEFDLLWRLLPQAISAKMVIVEKDPQELHGHRQLLNFGHTFGHCLESHYQIPHGEAVGYGLVFALNWSHHRGYLSLEFLTRALQVLQSRVHIRSSAQFLKIQKTLSRSRLRRLVSADKKLVDLDHLNFIFLERAGKAFIKKVTLDSFMTEAERQGWIEP